MPEGDGRGLDADEADAASSSWEGGSNDTAACLRMTQKLSFSSTASRQLPPALSGSSKFRLANLMQVGACNEGLGYDLSIKPYSLSPCGAGYGILSRRGLSWGQSTGQIATFRVLSHTMFPPACALSQFVWREPRAITLNRTLLEAGPTPALLGPLLPDLEGGRPLPGGPAGATAASSGGGELGGGLLPSFLRETLSCMRVRGWRLGVRGEWRMLSASGSPLLTPVSGPSTGGGALWQPLPPARTIRAGLVGEAAEGPGRGASGRSMEGGHV